MKRLIALILALVLVLALVACDNQATDPQKTDPSTIGSSSDGTPTALEGQKLGLMIYSTTTPWAINIIENFEALCEEFGMESAVAEAGNPGEIVAACENLLSANVTGILCMMDGGIGNKIMELCEAKKVYVSFTFADILNSDWFDEVKTKEYYAGSFNTDDYTAGYSMTQHCIDLGADTWVFLGMPEGTATGIDARATGFKECLADNNMQLLSEVRSYDKVEGAQNLVTNFPDLNGFGSGLNAAKNASGALDTAGKNGENEVFMFCYEAAESYVQEYFDSKRLHGCADGVSGHMEMAFAILCNALSGHKIMDSQGIAASYVVPYLIAYDSDDFATLIANSYDGKMIYSVDELRQMMSVFNADVSYDDFKKIVDDYSIEDIVARHGG